MPRILRFTSTPNPNAIRAELDARVVQPDGAAGPTREAFRSYSDPSHAEHDPLARALLGVPGVAGVFISTDGMWFTLTRRAESPWEPIKDAASRILLGWPA